MSDIKQSTLLLILFSIKDEFDEIFIKMIIFPHFFVEELFQAIADNFYAMPIPEKSKFSCYWQKIPSNLSIMLTG